MTLNTSTRQGDAPRAFAIIPAAGKSRRMGSDKLLLPWKGACVIDAVIDSWRTSQVDAIVIVVHTKNAQLIEHCRNLGVDVVIPDAPPRHMKDSVRLGLALIEERYQPSAGDHWLLAPGDVPELSSEVSRKVIQTARANPDAIVVPTCNKKRGHPPAFPWKLVPEVAKLDDDEGVKALLGQHRTMEVECGPAATPSDIDTPEDYRRLGGFQDT